MAFWDRVKGAVNRTIQFFSGEEQQPQRPPPEEMDFGFPAEQPPIQQREEEFGYFPPEPEPLPTEAITYSSNVTLTNDYGQRFTMTAEQWLTFAATSEGTDAYFSRMDATNPNGTPAPDALMGIDQLDIIRQLQSQGYDWEVWWYNEDGELEPHSGLWEEWRTMYEQAYGGS